MTALSFLYEKLVSGERFGMADQHRLGGTLFYETLSADKDFIYWYHFGSSANRISEENLSWILTEIFKLTPEEFLFKYITYKEWKRIDNCYKEKQDEVH